MIILNRGSSGSYGAHRINYGEHGIFRLGDIVEHDSLRSGTISSRKG